MTSVLLGPGAEALPVEHQTVLAQTLHLLLCLYADLIDQDIPVSLTFRLAWFPCIDFGIACI